MEGDPWQFLASGLVLGETIEGKVVSVEGLAQATRLPLDEVQVAVEDLVAQGLLAIAGETVTLSKSSQQNPAKLQELAETHLGLTLAAYQQTKQAA